jgi:ectoine hydroxylase-related dioxygenase (phytanoyl-CoA dioxygenase family)
MEVVPGSHKWGLLPESNFFEQDLDTLQSKIEAVAGRKLETVPCILPAGAVSFHHCLTIHGSRPNQSAGARISMVSHMMPEGTRYQAGTSADPHMNVRFLSGRDGDYFAGPYFPVIYREGQTENTWEVRS